MHIDLVVFFPDMCPFAKKICMRINHTCMCKKSMLYNTFFSNGFVLLINCHKLCYITELALSTAETDLPKETLVNPGPGKGKRKYSNLFTLKRKWKSSTTFEPGTSDFSDVEPSKGEIHFPFDVFDNTKMK